MRADKLRMEAVIFDLGGVLIENPVHSIIRYCSDYLIADPEKLMQAHQRHAPAFQRGIISESHYWKRICSDIDALEPDLLSLWGEAFRFSYRERAEIFLVASELRKAGYKIGLLSDTEIPSMNFFLAQNYEHFEYPVFSCIEGATKPEPTIYQSALKKMKTNPEQTVFIDDLILNVEGARHLGMNGILFTGAKQLINELNGLGIRF